MLEGNFFKVDNKKIKKLIYIYEKDLNNKLIIHKEYQYLKEIIKIFM